MSAKNVPPPRLKITIPRVQGMAAMIAMSALGAPLEDVIVSAAEDAKLLDGPVEREALLVRIPLSIPDGLGTGFAVGSFGDVGFYAEESKLALTVPLFVAPILRPRLVGHVVAERRAPPVEGRPAGALFVVALRPGARIGLPLGPLGELTLEAR